MSDPSLQRSIPHLRSYTLDEFLQIPDPEWLVEPFLPLDSLNVSFGTPGACKSLTALDLALCVATDLPWHGHSVKEGGAAYVVGEGLRGTKLRLRGWLQAHQIDSVPKLQLFGEPINLLDPAYVTAFMRSLQDPHPRLIVFDTLARCFVGGDENNGRDMNVLVDSVEQIRVKTGAAILLIHHTGKGNRSEVERGHSSLRGAANIMWLVKESSNEITITCEKSKDDDLFEPFYLRKQPIALSQDRSTVIVVDGESPGQAKLDEAFRALRGLPEKTASTGDWAKASGIPERTLRRLRETLVREGKVRPTPGLFGNYTVAV